LAKKASQFVTLIYLKILQLILNNNRALIRPLTN